MSDDCLFCKIIAGDIPSEEVYSDDDVYAFNDINPTAPVHLLVVPRRHLRSTDEFGADHHDELAACMQLIRDAARAAGLMPGGYRVVTNTGPDGGQAVPHLHFHVLGGRKLSWPPG